MDALSALKLQIEWGADEALDLEPVDRLRAPDRVAPAVPVASTPMAGAPPAIAVAATPRLTQVERATALAEAARTLPELQAAIAGFDGCPLRDTATHPVFAAGDSSASTLLVGEAPSADDDRSGQVFSGVIGGYLDGMLRSVGLDRGQMMLAPLIPWRPPGDRPPSAVELAMCLPFLFRLIVLLGPQRVVLFGPLATKSVMGDAAPRRRGQPAWAELSLRGLDQPIATLTSVSLPSLLRMPGARRDVWADLRLLRRGMKTNVTNK